MKDLERLQDGKRARRIELLTAMALVAVAGFVANYLLAPDFGLYEDDYGWVHALPPMSWSPGQILEGLRECWLDPVHNAFRPLYCTFAILLDWLTGRGSSLLPGFFIGFIIHCLNGVLMFRVARRLLTFEAAVAAALAYVTFMPDVSKVLLMHRGIYLGMTFLLCAVLCCQNGRYVSAYLLSASIVLIYESYYLPFVAAPFFSDNPEARRPKSLCRHFLIVAGLSAFFLALRTFSGDERAQLIAGHTFWEVLPKMVNACVIGSAVCFWRSLAAGPFDGFAHTDWVSLLAVFLAVGLGLQAMAWAVEAMRSASGAGPSATPCERSARGWIFLGGAIAVAAAYPLMFRQNYYPPTTVLGRLSAVHAAAAFGWAWLVGASVEWLGAKLSRRLATIALTATYFGLAINYGLSIERGEWVASWQQQRDFWKQLLAWRGNFAENEIILVDAAGLPEVPSVSLRTFLYNQATDVLVQFVRFPPAWSGHPRVFGVDLKFGPQVSATIPNDYHFDERSAGLCLHIPSWVPGGAWPVIQDGNFCVFTARGGALVPMNRPIRFYGKTFTPKRVDPDAPTTYTLTHVFRVVVR
ncbi:MAG: hypothetical protein JO069_23090 [Verrucomicrobia bacterium]|nr:hypothetical protein [Verrucomicrobiota bacterium]